MSVNPDQENWLAPSLPQLNVNTVVWARIDPWPHWPALVVSRGWAEQQISIELRAELPEDTEDNCTVMFFNYGNFIDVVDTIHIREFCEHVYLLQQAGMYENNVRSAAQEAIWWLLGSGKTTRAQRNALMNSEFRRILGDAGVRFEIRSPDKNSSTTGCKKRQLLTVDSIQNKLTTTEKEAFKSKFDSKKDILWKCTDREEKVSKNFGDSSTDIDVPLATLAGLRPSLYPSGSNSVKQLCEFREEKKSEEICTERNEEKQPEVQICEVNTKKKLEEICTLQSPEKQPGESRHVKSTAQESEGTKQDTSSEKKLVENFRQKSTEMEFEEPKFEKADVIDSRNEIKQAEEPIPKTNTDGKSEPRKRLNTEIGESIRDTRKLMKSEQSKQEGPAKKKHKDQSCEQITAQNEQNSIDLNPSNIENRFVKKSASQANENLTDLKRGNDSIQVSRLPVPVPRRFKNRALQLKNDRRTVHPKRNEAGKRFTKQKIKKTSKCVSKRSNRSFENYCGENSLSSSDRLCGTIPTGASVGLLNFKITQMSNSLQKLQKEAAELKVERKRIERQARQINDSLEFLQHQFIELRKLTRRAKRVKFIGWY